jgi:hypothetical protein
MHAGDPAIKVKVPLHFRTGRLLTIAVSEQDFWPRLKKHILPRIKAMLHFETPTSQSPAQAGLQPTGMENDSDQAELDGIIFKGDRMYRHHILRVNYTTYDVRHAQDTLNPNTAHRDIMFLSDLQSTSESHAHQFKYARLLGIYHVNIIYTGPGMQDYSPHRVEFLWVRWYENIESYPVQDGWDNCRLDQLRFPPMDHDSAFGFVDPAHVLRAFHSIPRFMSGWQYPDGVGISHCARDGKDWRIYFVNRSVVTLLHCLDDLDSISQHGGPRYGNAVSLGLCCWAQIQSSRISAGPAISPTIPNRYQI